MCDSWFSASFTAGVPLKWGRNTYADPDVLIPDLPQYVYPGFYGEGSASIDGVDGKATELKFGSADGFKLIELRPGEDADAAVFSAERKDYAAGGYQLGEMMAFPRELTTDERLALRAKLREKWFEEAAPELPVPDAVTLTVGQTLSFSDVTLPTTMALTISVPARRDLEPGTYTLLTSDKGFASSDISDWTVTVGGRRSSAKASFANGKLTIEAGAEIVCYGVATTVDGASINIAGGKFKEVRAGGTGTITLTGGIYSTEPTESYVATGYVVANNQDDATKAAYPWKVQEPTVTTEDEEPFVINIDPKAHEGAGESVPVAVTQDLAREILGETADVTNPLTAEQKTAIVTQLETKGEDGMTGWQKYAAGFSQTDKHPLAPKGKGGEDGKLVLVTSLVAPKQLSVDTGVKVKYILKKATKVNPTTGVPDDGDFEAVQELPTPEFPVDVAELPPETYWKIDVEYTATKTVEVKVEDIAK